MGKGNNEAYAIVVRNKRSRWSESAIKGPDGRLLTHLSKGRTGVPCVPVSLRTTFLPSLKSSAQKEMMSSTSMEKVVSATVRGSNVTSLVLVDEEGHVN
jgi:hypothetical protein